MNCIVLYEYYYMYCIAISKCGLWEHCVQAALYEAQPHAWRMLLHAFNRNNMPLGIILINVIYLAFSYPYIWLALSLSQWTLGFSFGYLPVHIGFWCGVEDDFPSILDVGMWFIANQALWPHLLGYKNI